MGEGQPHYDAHLTMSIGHRNGDGRVGLHGASAGADVTGTVRLQIAGLYRLIAGER